MSVSASNVIISHCHCHPTSNTMLEIWSCSHQRPLMQISLLSWNPHHHVTNLPSSPVIPSMRITLRKLFGQDSSLSKIPEPTSNSPEFAVLATINQVRSIITWLSRANLFSSTCPESFLRASAQFEPTTKNSAKSSRTRGSVRIQAKQKWTLASLKRSWIQLLQNPTYNCIH